jgi:serine/threonine protein kinase
MNDGEKPRELRDWYELLDRLGQGNYGEVYRARQMETGKIFAAKSINKKPHWSLNEFKRRIAQVCLALSAHVLLPHAPSPPPLVS